MSHYPKFPQYFSLDEDYEVDLHKAWQQQPERTNPLHHRSIRSPLMFSDPRYIPEEHHRPWIDYDDDTVWSYDKSDPVQYYYASDTDDDMDGVLFTHTVSPHWPESAPRTDPTKDGVRRSRSLGSQYRQKRKQQRKLSRQRTVPTQRQGRQQNPKLSPIESNIIGPELLTPSWIPPSLYSLPPRLPLPPPPPPPPPHPPHPPISAFPLPPLMMMPTVSQPPLATPIPLPWNNHYLHAMPPVMQGHNIPTEQTQLSAAPPDQNTGESLSTTDRPVKDNNDNKGCQPLSTSDNILCNSFNATYMPIQTAASSSNVDRELSRKAKAFEQRRFIWCYRPMGSAEDHHHSPAWAAFGLSNQRRLDQYPVRDDTFTGPLTIKEAKLPGTLMVLPQKGVAYHYRSLFSARHTLLDVRCLERTSDHELVFRTDNDEGGRKASGMMGKLWNAFFR